MKRMSIPAVLSDLTHTEHYVGLTSYGTPAYSYVGLIEWAQKNLNLSPKKADSFARQVVEKIDACGMPITIIYESDRTDYYR